MPHPAIAERAQRHRALSQLREMLNLHPNPDYDHEDITERLDGDRHIERFVAISEDETYSFVELFETLPEGEKSLTERTGESTGGNPVGILDLDTGKLFRPLIRVVVDRKSPADWSQWIGEGGIEV